MIPWLDIHTPFPDVSRALTDEAPRPAGGRRRTCRPRACSTPTGTAIFPWFSEGQPILWWSTDPRMVLMTENFKVSDSLAKAIRKVERSAATDGRWQLRFDGDFDAVMRACAAPRKDGPGTWISDEIIAGYTGLHKLGYAHSSDCGWTANWWAVRMACRSGACSSGESMFARVTDGSKIALAQLVRFLQARGVTMIDCQQETKHLASLGAAPISRARFLAHVRVAIEAAQITDWHAAPPA